MMRRTALLISCLLWPLIGAGAEPASSRAASAESLLELGDAAFRDGLARSGTDGNAARARFAEAAARWRESLAAGAAPTSRLWSNIGNAASLAGDSGRAVVAFRRALEIDPRDEVARAGLAVERAKVGVSVTPSIASRGERWLLSWRGYVPRWALGGAVVVAWSVAWGVGSLRVARGARALSVGVASLLLVSVACAVPLVGERVVRARARAAVVVDRAMAREGPSDAVYQQSFDRPLEPGVEVEVRERRDGWSRVALSDGREAWVAEFSLEQID